MTNAQKYNFQDFFENKLKVFELDPQYKAECALFELTECFFEINPTPNIIAKTMITIIEWLTDKLIYILLKKPKRINLD